MQIVPEIMMHKVRFDERKRKRSEMTSCSSWVLRFFDYDI